MTDRITDFRMSPAYSQLDETAYDLAVERGDAEDAINYAEAA